MKLEKSPFSELQLIHVGCGKFRVRGYIFGPDGGNVLLRSSNVAYELTLPGTIGSTCVYTIDEVIEGVVCGHCYSMSTNLPVGSSGAAVETIYFSPTAVADLDKMC